MVAIVSLIALTLDLITWKLVPFEVQTMLQRLSLIGCLAVILPLTACTSTTDTGSAALATNSSEETVAADKPARDPNAIKCKSYSQTGSRISKKVCRKNAEWDEAARTAREAAETVQRESVQSSGLKAN